MRRVYYLNPKRKQIVQEALLQMRATQKAFGPELMARLKLLVKDFDPDLLAQQLSGQVNPTPVPELEASLPERVTEPVDQKKNLLIIMKFLEIKQDDRSIQGRVRTLLSEAEILH